MKLLIPRGNKGVNQNIERSILPLSTHLADRCSSFVSLLPSFHPRERRSEGSAATAQVPADGGERRDQKAIDQATDKEQLDGLSEVRALAEIDQHDQRTEELDIEAVLDFAERVSLNAPRLWLEADLTSGRDSSRFCSQRVYRS